MSKKKPIQHLLPKTQKNYSGNILEYQPKEYIFTGQFGGDYSKRSLNRVIKQAAEHVGVTKTVTTQTLRHTFAAHFGCVIIINQVSLENILYYTH